MWQSVTSTAYRARCASSRRRAHAASPSSAKLGWSCDFAEDGEAAWARLHDDAQRARYAVLVTDCHMPRLDGHGLVERLRVHERARALARLPVLALTANALQGERERCLASGMDAYLAKPFQVDDLADALAELLGEAALSPG